MGGPAQIRLVHSPSETHAAKNLLETIRHRLLEIESKLSRYQPDSLLSQINRRAGSGIHTALDTETRQLLETCHTLWRESGGVFDPTAGVLRQIWDFQSNSIGDPARLPEVLGLVGFEGVSLNHEGVLLGKSGMELDLGGIGKEYAADVAASLIREAGFTRGLVDLAGDIVVVGENHLGKPWDIGIRDPATPTQSLLTVRLESAAIATSGGYFRTLLHGLNQVSHLLDPRTGLPVKGPSSVSVVAPHCLIAGAVSTVACLQPIDTAQEWLERSGLDWLMIAPSGDVTGPLLERSRIPL